ncbi:MAG: flagellar biosynthetic protein FliO [Angelakisella sp.]|nr:flagellar biosynthetic protein FliO [Angelakisella sp.]
MPEQLSIVLSALFMLIVFIGVLVLAYLATKFIGKRYSVPGLSANNIKIIDKVYFGQDRALIIVQVTGKTLLIGTTAHHIEKICDIDAELLNKPEPRSPQAFSQTFKQVLNNNWGIGQDGEDDKKEKPGNAR